MMASAYQVAMRRATEDRLRRKPATRRRPRLSRRTVLVGVVILLAMLWVIYWYGAGQIGAAALDRAAAAAAARGYTAECDDVAGGGFPFSIDLSCSRARFAGGGVQAAVDGFSATTPLYRPWTVRSTADGPLAISLPAGGSDITASWQRAETTIDAGIGGLSGIATRLEGLQLDLPAGTKALPFDSLDLARGEFTVTPASGNDYQASAVAHGIALKSESGRDVPHIDLDANLSFLGFGASLGLDPHRAVRAWIAAGGNLRIDQLTLVADAISANASGPLTLSADGKLSGDVDVTVTGIEALPDLVESFRPEARDQVEQIVAAVIAFTRPAKTPTGPARQMTLLVRESVVSIGILPIGVIPTLAF
jgi:hypothetical protein